MAREFTEEERAAIGERLRAGRARAANAQSAEQLIEPSATVQELLNFLGGIDQPWCAQNLPEHELRKVLPEFSRIVELLNEQLNRLEARRLADKCSACGTELPRGRFAGQISIHDPETQKIKTWRSCSEGCQRVIEGQAAQMRMKQLNGRQQGVRAF